ncbi:hypothetical protein [Ramlibacter montanisoli]|uniref:Peptidase C-terminal archaeal/bacterial domain-containing protein n=1 Tax=Ramlibacter montanisoli TaxID=2732512 RepID=A0A849KI60_9BURK|nr:hypothetical protein [Ramlibacter montanisoli]NNU43753.1 hypothetical protein [Ramlibacter montanisoli]
MVTGSIDPGNATQAWRFDAAAGDRVAFDFLSASDADMQWRLISPAGDQLFSSFFGSDVAERTLTQAGSYTLLVEGRRHHQSPNGYSFQVLPRGNTLAERISGIDDSFDGASLASHWGCPRAPAP